MDKNIIPQKPHDSWIFDKKNNIWIAPVLMPKDSKNYYWDENSKNWIPTGLQEINEEVK
jgi:hypothetical protein